MQGLEGSEADKAAVNRQQAHSSGVAALVGSPFFDNLVLSVGGWDWALWQADRLEAPLIRSATAPCAYTCVAWSPTRPGVTHLYRNFYGHSAARRQTSLAVQLATYMGYKGKKVLSRGQYAKSYPPQRPAQVGVPSPACSTSNGRPCASCYNNTPIQATLDFNASQQHFYNSRPSVWHHLHISELAQDCTCVQSPSLQSVPWPHEWHPGNNRWAKIQQDCWIPAITLQSTVSFEL